MKEERALVSAVPKTTFNPEIPRELHTVARSLWSKMTLSERFICPLIELIHLHIDVSDGLAVIQEIIESQAEEVLQMMKYTKAAGSMGWDGVWKEAA